MKKKLWKILKISGISITALFALLFLLPILFPGKIEEKIKEWTNQAISGELNFKKVRLSFFEHFPALTLTLHEFSLKGSAPFDKDTLIAGNTLSFGIDLGSVFGKAVRVNKFFIDKARINVSVDKNGNANYNIYNSDTSSTSTSQDSSNTQLKIEGIFITRSKLVYNDQSLPMVITADGFHYTGSGNLASTNFELASHLHADSLDFSYDGSTFLEKRSIDADLTTGINTTSLALTFRKNNILINKLPIDFSGNMTILKDGYDIDLKLVSGTTDFGNLFSILPPDYEDWFKDTRFKGTSRLTLDVKGNYRAAENRAPDLVTRLWVRDGQVNHKNAPAPLDHFNLVASVLLPKLNTDSLTLQVDTLDFDIKGKPSRATLYLQGINTPYIKADVNSQLDLALLDQAIGLSFAELKGQATFQLQADGKYTTGQNPKNFRPDTVITAIPVFQLKATIKNGYYKQKDLPLAIEKVDAAIEAASKDGLWNSITAAIKTIHAEIGKGFLDGHITLQGLEKTDLQANLKARLQLDDLEKAIPMKGYSFAGLFSTDFSANGRLDPEQKTFPVLKADLQLTNGRIQTPYYPAPIRDLEIKGQASSIKGSYQDLTVKFPAISFQFEGQPFEMTADCSNFNDLHYAITGKGTLDLTSIYQVFAIKDYAIAGKLKTDFSAKGKQSDAVAGRFANLKNSGTIEFNQMELSAKEYPAPFFIPTGKMEFIQDKAWLKNMVLQYRQNEFRLNGSAQNFISYLLQNDILIGNLTVESKKVNIDDFMAFAATDTAQVQQSATNTGVVLLPSNLNLTLVAGVKEVTYGKTTLTDFSGNLSLKNSHLQLSDTRFSIAGAIFTLGASYLPVDPRNARFTFTVKADSFDVKRAYHEIPLFHEMASAAAKAEGRISLDYALNGRLDDQMKPVLPSIKGKGALTLADVKINGLKLFSAVSKATGKDSINNPNLKAVVLKTSIQNNIITLERTKMRVFGFRPRIEGQTSLDGKLNLRFRLGLPPLGIIRIPMTITGTAENPIVKMKKGTESDELTEEADPETE
ncbi:AsmA family protein [Flavihumibacter fluvii]|uniref:AsmA family protein n=1 Tax=Flavihumibacter fluvii TaxID=2838157 RepID=UPI001BDEF06A|nr:AsmA-like C-terminal region-containing protein [Flavihumibacter fluvii]ULQ52679.1 AsmA-like C-terminal region-containing protein [Flavihumibacter fluvii]